MCGITGVLNLTTQKPVDKHQLQKANDALYHRGPDEEGSFLETNVGLAMRRLSIIDLSGGQQPIANEDGTIHIIYNGETYNHLNLREELERLGHQFSTKADTEVIVHAYEEWGIKGCLERLRGMYAFAIWDSKKQQLFLARDRMGIKPLYYIEHEGRLYFASEIRSMLIHGEIPPAIDLRALEAFMQIGFVTSPHTLFRGVKKLPAAHYLVADREQVSVHKYWELSYQIVTPASEQEVTEKFLSILRESVEMRLMSEVPLGGLLSGGIDSTTLVALMQQATTIPAHTISIGFDQIGYDESHLTNANAAALKTDHHHINFTGNSLDEYPQILAFMEEPLADAIFTTFYNLYRACRQQNLTVVLNGEGSDELLAGYHWHRGEKWVSPLLNLPAPIRQLLAKNPMLQRRGEAGERLSYLLTEAPKAVHRRYQAWLSIGRDHVDSNQLLSAEIKKALPGSGISPILESWSDYLINHADQPPLNKMLWIQSRTRMIDRSNHMVDRMSMAHSIEARVPFMDHKLWEFCATLPPEYKLHGFYFKLIEKYILRQATKDLIPDSTRVRKKQGLSAPYAAWLAQPRLPDWAETFLSEAELKKNDFFDPTAVRQLRQEHLSGKPHRATLLMGVLAIQTWADIFLNHPLSVPTVE